MSWVMFQAFFWLVLVPVIFLQSAWAAPELSSGTVCGQVLFEGNRAISGQDLRKAISFLEGDTLTQEKLTFSGKAIEREYENNGYWDARADVQVRPSSGNTANVTFAIEEGPLFHLREIRLSGNRLISDAIILRELDLSSGTPLSPLAVYDGNRRLYQTGYFEKIDITYSTAPGQAMDVLLNIKERPTRFMKGGVGYGAESKERVSLGFEDLNFLGNARRLNVNAVHSGFLTEPQKYRTTLLQADLTQRYLFGSAFQAYTSVFREYRERESYDSVTTAWHSTLSRRLTNFLTADFRLRYDGTRVENVSLEALDETGGFYRVASVGPALSLDSTEDPLSPREGWRFQVAFEQALNLGEGYVAFSKSKSVLSRYISWNSLTVLTAVQGGIILPPQSSDPIPIPERFTLGGANTVRGYAERGLGPKDARGEPLGGEGFGVASLELRHPVYKKVQGLVFLDAGQLWSRPPDQIWPHVRIKRITDVGFGTGFGFRFLSPVGPIRLELGYQLNPPPGSGNFMDRVEIHFALGEAF